MTPTLAAVDIGHGHVKTELRVDGRQLLRTCFPAHAVVASSTPERLMPAATGRHDVVCVQVHGCGYAVGKDVTHLCPASIDRSRDVAYSTSGQYHALLLGALWYLRRPVIDVLVVGLPMNTLRLHAERLRQALVGKHVVPAFAGSQDGDGTTMVVVKEVVVLGQPVGAFLSACEAEPWIARESSLLLDAGFHTLDLLGMRAGKVRTDRVAAFTGGVGSYIDLISESVIAWARQRDPQDPEALRLPSHMYEEALRDGRSLHTRIGRIDLSQHTRAAETLMDQYMSMVAAKLGEHGDVSVAVLSGGGARLMEAAFRRRFRGIHNVIVAHDPQFSVVHGFLLAAETYAQSKSREAP